MCDRLIYGRSHNNTYKKYADDKGCIVVRLDRALHGCVESAYLWYEHLSGMLAGLGYTKNPYDQCVFNTISADGVQVTVTVHVDDLLVTCCQEGPIMKLAESLRSRYGEIKCVHGPITNYLGMVFDTSVKGEARVTMKGFVDDLLKWYGGCGSAKSPAGEDLFDEKEEAEVCGEVVRKRFHSTVAKLLYLAKRARPDVLTSVSYLATRVQKCNTEDIRKLERVMNYLRATSGRGIVFRKGNEELQVRLFVDAAYGVHSNGKSHTGACVVIGDIGAVHCKSEKQRIVTKSSTEAELVALSDSCNQGLHVRKFLQSQGRSGCHHFVPG